MEKARDGYTIAFAGNLGKSRFLDQLIADGNYAFLNFALYGIQPSDRILESGFYRGVESPGRLPDVLEGDFGLVWDGENLEEGQEAAGRYLQYNCPHKFSLYMAAGIPVIIGKQAAMAELVEREKLGITVHDLHELSDYISVRIENPAPNRHRKSSICNIDSDIFFYVCTAWNSNVRNSSMCTGA